MPLAGPMALDSGNGNGRIPVLLLKTKSTPGDAYEELFFSSQGPFEFQPAFVPVLEHRFEHEGMNKVASLLQNKQVASLPHGSYGGLIFTSQRAVEAFAKLVLDGKDVDDRWPHLQQVPIYSVGPATTRALKAVQQEPPLQVFGDHTGNGDELAKFILDHYGTWYADRLTKPPLLFLVGEQRRDIIPKTLMDGSLQPDKIIQVDEIVVYETGVMSSFFDDFQQTLETTKSSRMRWVVVFSPTGCDGMLRALDATDPDGKAKPKPPDRTTFIATIGPTTRRHLKKVYGFEPDVCAEQPSPEGVRNGILQFIENLSK